MKIYLANHTIISDKREGLLSGDWVSISNYKFDLAAYYLHHHYVHFYIGGILDIRFDDGGSIEYICQLTYNLSGFEGRPDIEALIDIAHEKAPIDLEEMFIKYGLWAMQSTADELWTPYDRERLRPLIAEAIEKMSL